MENKRNLGKNETIAKIYAIERADNICGREKICSDVWNKQYKQHYQEKMKELTREKSTRELALEWWNNLEIYQKTAIQFKYNPQERQLTSLTGREIEKIWRIETNQDAEDGEKLHAHLKPNQKQFIDKPQSKEIRKALDNKYNAKQFKEFNPELFQSYISKFSDEDKLKALKVLFWSLKSENMFHVTEIGIDKL
jgi:hypothetical protein